VGQGPGVIINQSKLFASDSWWRVSLYLAFSVYININYSKKIINVVFFLYIWPSKKLMLVWPLFRHGVCFSKVTWQLSHDPCDYVVLQSLRIFNKKHIIPIWIAEIKRNFKYCWIIQSLFLFIFLVISSSKYVLCWGGDEENWKKGKASGSCHHCINSLWS